MKRIKLVEIYNIRGIEHLRLEVGNVVVIQGENGAGKSSVLDALRAVFEGGNDPRLIRVGAKSGEVKIEMIDGTLIHKKIRERSGELIITDPTGEVVKAPQSYVEQLATGFSFDPLAILTAKPKDRAAFLLEAMPITFTREEIEKATSRPMQTDLDLDGLDALRKSLYEERTKHNREERDAEGTVRTLRQSLGGDEDAIDWAAREAELNRKLETARTLARDEQERIIRARDEKIDELRAVFEAGVATARKEAEDALREVIEETANVVDPLQAAHAEARAKADLKQRQLGTRYLIEQHTQRGQEAARSAGLLTAGIERIDALREKKLASLPVPGLTFRDGDIHVGDIPFGYANTALQIEIAFELAKLRTGDLPLLILDGAERLDPEAYLGFMEAAKSSGMQVVAAKVTDGPLAVTAA